MNTTSQSQGHIVLIEDEQTLASLLTKKLKQAGYTVTYKDDGEVGLEAIRNDDPDLVLLDMTLPKQSGHNILEKLHEADIIPGLPVIIISNSGDPVKINRAKELGITDHLIKLNFDPNEVIKKVEAALGEQSKTVSIDNNNAPQNDKHDDDTEASPATKEVLVVEDDTFLMDLLSRQLTQQGYNISQATSVPKAKDILKEKQVDIICLDILLANVNGMTLLKELKDEDSEYADIPIIMISNLGQKEKINEAKKAGAEDYIVKANATPKEIVERITNVL